MTVFTGLKIRYREDDVGRCPIHSFTGRHARKSNAPGVYHGWSQLTAEENPQPRKLRVH
jgi:hypothetical protein